MIKVGTEDITLKFGSADIDKIYIGEVEIYTKPTEE